MDVNQLPQLKLANLHEKMGVSDYTLTKAKLDELFVHWLSQKDTGDLLLSVVEAACEGRPVPSPPLAQALAPLAAFGLEPSPPPSLTQAAAAAAAAQQPQPFGGAPASDPLSLSPERGGRSLGAALAAAGAGGSPSGAGHRSSPSASGNGSGGGGSSPPPRSPPAGGFTAYNSPPASLPSSPSSHSPHALSLAAGANVPAPLHPRRALDLGHAAAAAAAGHAATSEEEEARASEGATGEASAGGQDVDDEEEDGVRNEEATAPASATATPAAAAAALPAAAPCALPRFYVPGGGGTRGGGVLRLAHGAARGTVRRLRDHPSMRGSTAQAAAAAAAAVAAAGAGAAGTGTAEGLGEDQSTTRGGAHSEASAGGGGGGGGDEDGSSWWADVAACWERCGPAPSPEAPPQTAPSSPAAPTRSAEAAAAAAAAVAKGTDERAEALLLGVSAFATITTEVCGLPSLLNRPLMARIRQWDRRRATRSAAQALRTPAAGDGAQADAALAAGGDEAADADGGPEPWDDTLTVSLGAFLRYYPSQVAPYDEDERFFRLAAPLGHRHVCVGDLCVLVDEVLALHPGLAFLSDHAEFMDKYSLTVATRVMYDANAVSRTGRLSLREWRRARVLDAWRTCDAEEDINRVVRWFSYEHFYVLYCRFWELDTDHDGLVSRGDVLRYGGHKLSEAIVDRVFEVGHSPRPPEPRSALSSATDAAAAGGPAAADRTTHMRYDDFVFLMLAEEDKGSPAGLAYWFRCADLDDDGVLSRTDLAPLYAAQALRMEQLGHEGVALDDVLCQMWDMVHPLHPGRGVRMGDLLRPDLAQTAGVLFDALFNLDKFLGFEQRDPLSEKHKREDPFECDWDRFAYTEYNRLAQEEEAREEMELDGGGFDAGDAMDGWGDGGGGGY